MKTVKKLTENKNKSEKITYPLAGGSQEVLPQMPMQPFLADLSGVHILPFLHLTRAATKAPVLGFLLCSMKMPALLGNLLPLHQAPLEALVAVVGLTVGVEPLVPAFVESAVIHICTSKDFRFSIIAE